MTTPAEKDAMALVDRLREAERNPYGAVRDPEVRASIAAEAADTIEALNARATRAEAELAEFKKNNRWNVRETDAGLAVCRGDHDKSQGCDEVLYVRADKAEAELAAVRANAERYVWCRANVAKDTADLCVYIEFGYDRFGMDIDAAIDAARGAG